MKQIKSIEEAWSNLEAGRVVYCGNKSYRLTLEEVRRHGVNEDTAKYQEAHHSYKNNYVLRVTCTSNWFGSLISESEVSQLFTDENY